MNDPKGALAVWNALAGKVRQLIRDQTKSAVRKKKMNIAAISTANQTVTVYEASDPTKTITVPYRAGQGIEALSAGQSVIVEWIYDDLSTAVAATPGQGWSARGLISYTSVTRLGLTSGSATILAAFKAMPDNSVLIVNAGEFASSEVPSVYGMVEIQRQSYGREAVFFWGKNSGNKDYRMFIAGTAYNGNDVNAPSGNWVEILTSANDSSLTPTITGASGVTISMSNVYRRAKTAFANFEFTLSSVPSDWTTIASGLPAPPTAWYDFAFSSASAYVRPVRVRVTTGGLLQIRYGAATKFDLTLSYPIYQ